MTLTVTLKDSSSEAVTAAINCALQSLPNLETISPITHATIYTKDGDSMLSIAIPLLTNLQMHFGRPMQAALIQAIPSTQDHSYILLKLGIIE